jgi:DNA-binding NarL/FixJ family response regulator
MDGALSRDGLAVAGEADSPEELRAACMRRRPHVAVIAEAACAPDLGASLRRLRRSLPRTRIVAVLAQERRGDVRAALDVGADAVVLESRLAATLAVTVRAVCAGQACVPRELRRQLERPALSAREKEVLGMVAAGFSNPEIAVRLYLAESTVKGHLVSAFGKLGIHSREEAAALVRDRDARLGIALLPFPAPPDPVGNGASR